MNHKNNLEMPHGVSAVNENLTSIGTATVARRALLSCGKFEFSHDIALSFLVLYTYVSTYFSENILYLFDILSFCI